METKEIVKIETIKTILPIVGIGVGGFLLWQYFLKPILIKTGVKEDPKVLETEKQNKELIDKEVEILTKKQAPTKSITQWKIIADQIYADLRYTSLDDDKPNAVYQLKRVQNNTDFAVLFKYFAKRREYAFGIPVGDLKNLSQFVTSNLSTSQIAEINKNYGTKKLTFRF
jgi:hypothetical protein